jgi:hypothetical protein
MVTPSETFDVAILVSGDADRIPSIRYLKTRNKQVAAIEFVTGYPPEKKGKGFSSELKLVADFVVRMYEMELITKGLAQKALRAVEKWCEGAGLTSTEPPEVHGVTWQPHLVSQEDGLRHVRFSFCSIICFGTVLRIQIGVAEKTSINLRRARGQPDTMDRALPARAGRLWRVWRYTEL